MLKATSRQVLTLVTGGYALLVLLVIGSGLMAVEAMRRLHAVTEELYVHPFLVSNAALDARATALLLRNQMLQVALSGSPESMARFSAEVDSLDGQVRADLATVREGFLGDPTIIDEAERQLARWSDIRNRTVSLVLQGDRDQARDLITGSNATFFEGLFGAIDEVVEYARSRAGRFVEEGDRDAVAAIRLVGFALAGMVAIIGLAGLTVVRRVSAVLHREQGMESALGQSEDRWKFALEGAGDGVWDWTIPTGEVLFSKRLQEMLGYADEEFPHRLEEWKERVHPDDLPRVMTEVQECLDGKTLHYATEQRVRCKSGEWKWILDRGMVVSRDQEGTPLRMIGTNSDITERVAAEEKRRQLEHQLRQAQRLEAIGTLAGGIAHDFNNILGAILGNVELARQDVGHDHPALESLVQIRKSSERARDLVQQILAFSRSRAQPFDTLSLGEAVEESVRLLRATLPAGVALETSITTTPLRVRGEESQLHQILLNLCINAWQAMEGRPGRIGIQLDEVVLDAAAVASLPGLQAGRHAHLSICDDGKGMDEATQARIFEPFFTTKPVGQGTGLGLAVVHGIVQAHRGSIVVQGTEGAGTRVDLYFPLVEDPLSPAVPASPSGTVGHGRRIVYVDDDGAMTYMVRRVLERAGYRVSAFERAEDAVAAVRADPSAFDLVVTDYNMPTLSGIDVAREVARIQADLPVLLISGYITDDLREEARQIGVRHIIDKPNTVNALCEAIGQVLQSHEPGSRQA